MQVRTKKHHTDIIDLCISGPRSHMEQVIAEIKKHGFVNTSDSIPWRQLFPEFDGQPPYSVALRGARHKEGLTQAELAAIVSIPQAHISLMENGKMEIGKERAKRLAAALNIDYRVFL